jgi:hypothetical protein
MNDYLPYIGILGFILLCALQVKLWCNLYHTCGVMWTGLKNWFKTPKQKDEDWIKRKGE